MLQMCGFAAFVEGRVLVAGDEEWFSVSGCVSIAIRRFQWSTFCWKKQNRGEGNISFLS